MITADFTSTNNTLCGFAMSGHAGYADAGEDIVCAAATSAVQLTVNNITQIFGIPADVSVTENTIKCKVSHKSSVAEGLLDGLRLHLEILAEDYEGTIKVNVLEV